MKIQLGSSILEITLTNYDWKKRVVQEVKKMQEKYPGDYGTKAFDNGTTNAKIRRVKAVRQLAALFPEDEREYGGTYGTYEDGDPLLGLRFCKEFVETNWTENGYGDPVL